MTKEFGLFFIRFFTKFKSILLFFEMMSEYKAWTVSYKRRESRLASVAENEIDQRAVESYMIVAENSGEAIRKANKQFRSDSYREGRFSPNYEASVEPFSLHINVPEFTLLEDQERFNFIPDWVSADSLEFIVDEKREL
ncbi:MAG: hypothetical protein Q8R53_03370 [Nanoarchaeota archaeon]|nr:hypothetical protein [Nanoarchaeota archaeon]